MVHAQLTLGKLENSHWYRGNMQTAHRPGLEPRTLLLRGNSVEQRIAVLEILTNKKREVHLWKLACLFQNIPVTYLGQNRLGTQWVCCLETTHNRDSTCCISRFSSVIRYCTSLSAAQLIPGIITTVTTAALSCFALKVHGGRFSKDKRHSTWKLTEQGWTWDSFWRSVWFITGWFVEPWPTGTRWLSLTHYSPPHEMKAELTHPNIPSPSQSTWKNNLYITHCLLRLQWRCNQCFT